MEGNSKHFPGRHSLLNNLNPKILRRNPVLTEFIRDRILSFIPINEDKNGDQTEDRELDFFYQSLLRIECWSWLISQCSKGRKQKFEPRGEVNGCNKNKKCRILQAMRTVITTTILMIFFQVEAQGSKCLGNKLSITATRGLNQSIFCHIWANVDIR